MNLTILEFAKITKTDYVVAAATLKFLSKKGIVKVVDKIKKPRGKPTLVYFVPQTISFEVNNA